MNLILFTVATSLLVHRAYTRNSLTPAGILAAVTTAGLHATSAWNAPFVLLITFYMMGTAATKVKHDVKSRLTLSSVGAGGGEGPRGWVQVVANSVVASVLTVVHAAREDAGACWGPADLLYVGIVANYAAVAADTLSSELGILARSPPRLITTLRVCPPGTNGGVTAAGLGAGVAGAFTIAVIGAALTPFCEGTGFGERARFVALITAAGVAGTLLDSLLGALLQESVVDTRSGKIVEAPGGGRVLVAPRFGSTAPPSRKVLTGRGLLTNNGVNFAMALNISVGAMAVASVLWGVNKL